MARTNHNQIRSKEVIAKAVQWRSLSPIRLRHEARRKKLQRLPSLSWLSLLLSRLIHCCERICHHHDCDSKKLPRRNGYSGSPRKPWALSCKLVPGLPLWCRTGLVPRSLINFQLESNVQLERSRASSSSWISRARAYCTSVLIPIDSLRILLQVYQARSGL